MEQLTTRIGIEPGPGLVGRFGETVIVIPRGDGAGSASPSAGVTQELLGLAAEVGSDREASANAIASQLAAWVIGHMPGDGGGRPEGSREFWFWPPVPPSVKRIRVTVSTLWEAAWAELDIPGRPG